MTTQTATRKKIDTTVANTILRQLGFWRRGCMDMGRNFTFTENSVTFPNCLVVTNPNQRGSVTIALNDEDLYDVTFTRKGDGRGYTVPNLYTDQLLDLFGEVSGYQQAGIWSSDHEAFFAAPADEVEELRKNVE